MEQRWQQERYAALVVQDAAEAKRDAARAKRETAYAEWVAAYAEWRVAEDKRVAGLGSVGGPGG